MKLEDPEEIGDRVQRECPYGVERADIAAAIKDDRKEIAECVEWVGGAATDTELGERVAALVAALRNP